MRPLRLALSVGLPGPGEASDRLEDPIDILRTDPRMNGEFEEPRDEVLRDGTATADPEVLEGLLLVQGHRVRWPAADAFLVQDPDDLVAGDWKGVLATDDVLVVGMDHPVAFGRGREAFDFLESFRQGPGVRPTLLHPAVELPQLYEADRRGDLGHAVVVAEESMLILRHLPVVPEQTRFVRDRVVVRDDHAALAGRHILGRVEREAGRVAEVARLLAVVFRAVGLGRVLDHREGLTPSGIEDRVHLRRLAVQMDRHDRGGLARDPNREPRGIHVVGISYHIDEDRLRPALEDRRRGREEGERWSEDLVPLTDAMRRECDVEGFRPIRNGDAVFTSDVLGER